MSNQSAIITKKKYGVTVTFADRGPMDYTTSDYKEAVKFRAYYNLRKRAKYNYMRITGVKMETI